MRPIRFRAVQGQCEQLCVAVAQHPDFREVHGPQERAAAEARHTAGRIRPANGRETGGEGGCAGAHRRPNGVGAIPRSAAVRRSAEEAARQIERKYDLGAATVTDYNAAVSAAVKARSQRLQAKYEYLFKIKTLTYYTNYDYGE